MYYTVIEARQVKDYTLWFRFGDGTEAAQLQPVRRAAYFIAGRAIMASRLPYA